jgi:uncharacterized protein YjbK
MEIEYKSLISKEKFKELKESLLEFSTFKEEYEQINYYFDTVDKKMDQKKITFRIRLKKETFEMTAKVKSGNKNNVYHSMQEFNISLGKEEALLFLKEKQIPKKHPLLLKIMSELEINISEPLLLLGELKTIRRDYIRENDLISLDKNKYSNITDYEIEWETTDHSFVEKINKKLKLTFGNGKGKRKRFFKTL